MTPKNKKIVKDMIEVIKTKGYPVEEYANGHIKVYGHNFWCTTQRYVLIDGTSGRGLSYFLKAISLEGV